MQVSHFFGRNFAFGAKGTIINNATQTIFGHDDGYEAGIRASVYTASNSGQAHFGIHVGLYYASFRRGDDPGDLITSAFGSPYLDRDELNGPIVELMAGILVPTARWVSIEFLGGLQSYQITYYSYNRSTGNRVVRQPSSWKLYPVLELNLGIIF